MNLSIFDLFKVGIGPSSSHTVGPMLAAARFARELANQHLLTQVHHLQVDLYGSLAATGDGHGTITAVVLGLEGAQPDTLDCDSVPLRMQSIREQGLIQLNGEHGVHFDVSQQVRLLAQQSLPFHPNGMGFCALNSQGQILLQEEFYSVGGGFIVTAQEAEQPQLAMDQGVEFPFNSAEQLLQLCAEHQLNISDVVLLNEATFQGHHETRQRLLHVWQVMQACIERGISNEGILPGGLDIKRRAPALHQDLLAKPEASLTDPLTVMDWVTLYALAVNEENAAGGRVVTAPTNGAAGIIPAVLQYYVRFIAGANDEGIIKFLATAAAIGMLYKTNASISGAEVGCQGEVGSACSMAAGALTEVLGGNPQQVENAAEIAMEHNLGLTCDPVGGLVQVPCIERNAMASIKAITAARMALRGDGEHFVSLDKVIQTMKETGRDMQDKYKETARGGLATNAIEVPVNIIEC